MGSSTASRSSGSAGCACASAARGRRSCCCTGIRARTRRGTGSRRCWSTPASPSSARTCPGYGESRRRGATSPSARWRRDRGRVMRALGFERYAAVGHDRGVGVAHRLAVDHGVDPARGAGRRADRRGARALRRALRRELVALVLLRPDGEARGGRSSRATRWPGTAATRTRWAPRTTPTGCARCTNPDVVRAMVADYRAGLRGRPADEAADRAAGRCVACPTLFAWSAHDDMEELYGDPLAIWRAWVAGRCAVRGSTPATTWPRRRRSSSRRCWRSSSVLELEPARL